jgi:hypothetical protein
MLAVAPAQAGRAWGGHGAAASVDDDKIAVVVDACSCDEVCAYSQRHDFSVPAGLGIAS